MSPPTFQSYQSPLALSDCHDPAADEDTGGLGNSNWFEVIIDRLFFASSNVISVKFLSIPANPPAGDPRQLTGKTAGHDFTQAPHCPPAKKPNPSPQPPFIVAFLRLT